MPKYETLIENCLPEWSYPVRYGEETEVSGDVLILGGGIAGCHAAINAARKGAKVIVVDKAPVIRSGSGGAGVDHWHVAFTNPCSKVTPEEFMEVFESFGGYGYGGHGNGLSGYISAKESWDALLDVEKMGIKIRDVDDEFAGADFRDEKTKLMFAYDYEAKHIIRVQGAKIKVALYKELKRLGVQIYDRVMATSLLTEGGKPGARVIGATGVNVRTGEFYIFKAKATVLSAGIPSRLWVFTTELRGFGAGTGDPNNAGGGSVMAWEAGAELTMMEKSGLEGGPYGYPNYGTGNAHNTWFACTIVDANGKEIPWVDRDGRVLKTVEERYRPAPGQKFFMHGPVVTYEVQGASLIKDLPDRIIKGEYVLPFYADLSAMPEHERRAIFGLMVGHEGKTRIPIYVNYTQAGFDPDKDMLQANVLPPKRAGLHSPWWIGMGAPQWRGVAFGGGGGLLFDWDLRTSLEGLYVAGNQTAFGGDHAVASATGRYAGRKAAVNAQEADDPVVDRKQVDIEKTRVYAPVNRKDGIGWKELQAGISRIMQDYCGEYKSEEILKAGLRWLDSIRESEAANAYARNPHELWRTLECMERLRAGEIVMHASLVRKASSAALDFKRTDYPEMDPPEWNKYVVIKLVDGDVEVGELPFNYWLLPPYAPTYEENYMQHADL